MGSFTISTEIALLLTLVALSYIPSSDGHGQMCEPRQRGAYKTAAGRCVYDKDIGESNVVVDYCPHCLSGGTVGTVTQNLPPSGWAVYDPINDITTAQRAGLCGDAHGGTDHLLGGRFVPPRYEDVPILNVSQTGGTIDFSMQIDTNHNGYFDFFLCDLDACGTSDIDDSCFTNGHCHKLQRVAHPTCESPSTNTEYFCAPIDPAYPGRWYIPCRAQKIVVGGDNGIMRYKLPDSITCKHCVLQWYWATANSCNPRGQIPFFDTHFSNLEAVCSAIGGGQVARNPGVSECGGSKVPEEFWSCGDIQISTDGNSLGAVPIGDPTPSTTPSASTEPSVSPVAVTLSATPSMSATPVNTDVSSETTAPTATPSVSVSPTAQASPSSTVEEESCLAEGDVCDGSVPCCIFEHVCVHTIRGGGFTCIPWFRLWQEVSDQRNSRT